MCLCGCSPQILQGSHLPLILQLLVALGLRLSHSNLCFYYHMELFAVFSHAISM